jgi:hypothetical protein
LEQSLLLLVSWLSFLELLDFALVLPFANPLQREVAVAALDRGKQTNLTVNQMINCIVLEAGYG